MSFIPTSKLRLLFENLKTEINKGELPYKVYKFTFKNKESDGKTYYIKSENQDTPESARRQWLIQLYSNSYKSDDVMNRWLAKDPNHVFGILLKNYTKAQATDLIDAELAGEFDTERDSLIFRREQSQNDPNSINKSTSIDVSGRRSIDATGRVNTKNIKRPATRTSTSSNTVPKNNNDKKIELKKSDILRTTNGEVYINTLVLQRDKELAKALKSIISPQSTVNFPLGHPKAGNYVKADPNKITIV